MGPADKKKMSSIPRAAHGSKPMATSSTDTTLPAPPPRAAMVNASNTDTHDTTSTSINPDQKEKEKEKDMPSSTSGNLSRSSTKSHQRDTASSAALLVQLRQKEETIDKLQAEMNLMEREFQRELDKLSQNESETATFWQTKHSVLNQQFLRADTELRLIRSEVEVRDAEREELRHGWEIMQREIKEKDAEVRGLKSQVRGLKEFVSTSTRTDGQTSDEVFGDGMARLGNGLQNWVIQHFRKAKLDLEGASEASITELGELVPMYEELAKIAKVHLLQSAVSKILVDMVFNAYFVGLDSQQTQLFQQMEELLAQFSHSEEPVNQWRANTLSLLHRDAPNMFSAPTTTLTNDVVTRITHLLTSLTDAPASSPPRDAALRALIGNAIDLARLLAVQKAVLRVYMPEILPHQRVHFEADVMEDIGGEEEDGLEAREIWCCVFPGVIKRGDENGGQMQFRNVICKARVLCSPES